MVPSCADRFSFDFMYSCKAFREEMHTEGISKAVLTKISTLGAAILSRNSLNCQTLKLCL